MAQKKEIITKNKKAGFEYEFVDMFNAGIQLTGSEIKSIRAHKVNLSDSYCVFMKGELWIKNMHIAPYKDASYNNHEPKRDRKLLLQKHELKRLNDKVKTSGLTIVPTKVYINDRGFAKVQIALAKGKKLHDKRESIKRKEDKRAMDRAMKQ